MKSDERGHIAILTGIVGIPLLVGTAVAVDIGNSIRLKTNLRAALDTAALAGVLHASESDVAREAYTLQVFNDNFVRDEILNLDLDIDAVTGKVSLVAEVTVPALLTGIIGRETLSINADSEAIATTSSIICLVALDPTRKRSIEFLDLSELLPPTCSVQSNSNNVAAIVSESNKTPVAQSFCAAGGALGQFYPNANTECRTVADPYADLEIPEAASSCDSRQQVTVMGSKGIGGGQAFLESQLATDADGNSIIPDHAILSPGIYCKGMSISGANVVLEPGVYHIWGDLEFTENASVYGDRVTFILKGTDNSLNIRDGAEVYLRAPEDGLTAGLVFWQKYLEFWPYAFGIVSPSPNRVVATSTVSSGGGLTIIGTAYFPDHQLIISSDRTLASRSPATSFIARRVQFSGDAVMHASVDHVAGKVPPLLPRADETARLIR